MKTFNQLETVNKIYYCCPVCKSRKITTTFKFPLYVAYDANTGNEIVYNKEGKRVYKITNKIIVQLYKQAQTYGEEYVHSCRKCGWEGELITSEE